MAVNLSPVFGVAGQLFDDNGNPLAGGKIYTYLAGTTTNATTYTNSVGNIAHSNPIVLDGAGRVPSGEIWLTDGIVYKFVVEDANNVLIGTYDNLVGINSNFIAYTSQQEIQTATAGQTVFNLTTMQYQPNTNNLSVFVDGVNQYGPGAQYAFVETDQDTVTFVSGLHVGASVKFTTASPVASGATDAENVSYTPPFVSSVTTNVENKLAESVSVTDFGAVGDGVTDDTTAFTNAQNAADFVFIPANKNYKVNAGLDYWKFYGDGAVFQPSRQWTVNPYPQTGDMSKTYNPRTFGTYETAVGSSITINSGLNQTITNTQVLGTDAQGLAQVYTDRDHVAQYMSAASFTPDVLSSSSTYTATSVTNAAISGLDIKPGMIIDTLHAIKCTGIVSSVSGNTANVTAWFPATPPAAGPVTPANGTGAIINPNTKIFGQNIVVTANGNGSTTGASKLTGVELDIFTGASASPIANTWGYDIYSAGGSYMDVGYQIRGKRNISFFSRNDGGAGLFGFRSVGDGKGLSIEDSTTLPIEVISSSALKFSVSNAGILQLLGGKIVPIGPLQTTGSYVSIGQAWSTGYGGLFYITGFNTSGGAEGKFLFAANNTSTGQIYAADSSGCTVQFQVSGSNLQIRATTGTFQFSGFQLLAG